MRKVTGWYNSLLLNENRSLERETSKVRHYWEVRHGDVLTKDKILLIKTGSKQKRVESDQSTGKMAYPARIGNWV